VTVGKEVWPNGVPEVGQIAKRSRQVTSRDIELFTEISGDRNPLHYDLQVARATRFGGIVVQGGVTSAILKIIYIHPALQEITMDAVRTALENFE
jgi:acyl dehydratase